MITEWYKLYLDKVLSDCDLCCAFILACLAARRPKKWACGNMKPSVISDQEEKLDLSLVSSPIVDIPGLLNFLGKPYIEAKMERRAEEISVIQIFNQIQFTGIKKNYKNYVNTTMVFWALKKRPYSLHFRIPTPMEVLQMQGRGQRVVTLFITMEELKSKHQAQLHYMSGNTRSSSIFRCIINANNKNSEKRIFSNLGSQNHSRDAFEFLIHDLSHMEHFMSPQIYSEQVIVRCFALYKV